MQPSTLRSRGVEAYQGYSALRTSELVAHLHGLSILQDPLHEGSNFYGALICYQEHSTMQRVLMVQAREHHQYEYWQ